MPQFVDLISEQVTSGGPVAEVVMTATVFEHLQSEHPEECAALGDAPRL